VELVTVQAVVSQQMIIHPSVEM